MVNEGIEITVIDGGTYVGTVEVVAVPIVVGGGCFQDLKADVSLVSYNKKLESVQVANVVQESAHFCGCLITQYWDVNGLKIQVRLDILVRLGLITFYDL